ncbi:MAG: hypothetical protein GY953_42525, partial [bacterium]|nr:hypothetical protein [bacterium]
KVEPKWETADGKRPLPVVTLLARPEEADVLGLADASAQIRLVLRHPLDDEITPRGSITLAGALKKAPPKHKPATSVSKSADPKEPAENRPVQSADGRRSRP